MTIFWIVQKIGLALILLGLCNAVASCLATLDQSSYGKVVSYVFKALWLNPVVIFFTLALTILMGLFSGAPGVAAMLMAYVVIILSTFVGILAGLRIIASRAPRSE